MSEGVKYEYMLANIQYDIEQYIGKHIEKTKRGKINSDEETNCWLLKNYLNLIMLHSTTDTFNLLTDEQMDNILTDAQYILNKTYNYSYQW